MQMQSRPLRVGIMLSGLLCAAMTALPQSLPISPEPEPQISTPALSNPPAYLCTTQLQRAQNAIHKQDFPAGIDAAKAGLSTCPGQRDLLLTLADAQMLSHQFDSAIQSLHELLVKSPSDVPALLLLGQTQYLNAHDVDATISFQRAIAVAPNNPEPHYWLGRLKYQNGDVPKAMAEFQQAIRLDADFYRAYDNLGLCYEALGENGHAMENYVHALKLVYKDHPEYDDVYLNMAALMLKLGNSQRAFDLASEASSRNPRNPRSFFLAGKALEQAGQNDVSLKWLNQAAQMDPAYPDPHYLLSRIYRKQGKTQESENEAAKFKLLTDKAPKIKR